MTKVYLDELEDIGSELVSYSENNISSGVNELKVATNNLIWQGPAYNSFIMGYNTKINELVKMNESLTKIARFLLIAKDNYSDTNARINNAYEELLEEFNRIGK